MTPEKDLQIQSTHSKLIGLDDFTLGNAPCVVNLKTAFNGPCMTKPHIAFAVPGKITTLTGGYIYDRRVMHELRDLGWTVDHIALPAGFPDPSPQQMRAALDLLQAIPADRPVIIDGLAYGALDPTGVAKIKAPIVALVHHPLAKESGLDKAQRATLLATERTNLREAVKILVPSPHTRDNLLAEYGVAATKITIAKPGIDQPKTPPTPTQPPLILSVGIQLPRKGHDVLLRALAQITDLDWHCVIVGTALDPSCAAKLQQIKTALNLDSRVTLAGQVDQDTLAAHYQTASLFALATRFEGYGIVFDEALVHGLPIVSCDTGAVADTVPAQAGLLVPPDQPTAFADALRKLLSDTQQRDMMAAASAHAGRKRPGWHDTAAHFAQVLDQVCPGKDQS